MSEHVCKPEPLFDTESVIYYKCDCGKRFWKFKEDVEEKKENKENINRFF